jgi:hypothetical protein
VRPFFFLFLRSVSSSSLSFIHSLLCLFLFLCFLLLFSSLQRTAAAEREMAGAEGSTAAWIGGCGRRPEEAATWSDGTAQVRVVELQVVNCDLGLG